MLMGFLNRGTEFEVRDTGSYDKRRCCRTWVGIIGEAAVAAFLAFEVIDLEMRRAAYRTKPELL